ncbi:hypothetical protein IJ118_00020 [Candidatus Saccharibacteria bacterium]|nr:hypothetical protein [Candidatus Saccharibacteria bacterium]
MSRLITRIAVSITGLLMSLTLIAVPPVIVSAPVYATDEEMLNVKNDACTCGVDSKGNPITGHKPMASILTDVCECGGGESIMGIIRFVVNILSIGVGIIAAIGITIAGVQYTTAGGNEEQTRKSKRRILEIVIGLAAYALLYAVLQFVLPNFVGI